MSEYRENVHRYGRIWSAAALTLLLGAPTAVCLYFGVLPEWKGVLQGLLAVVPVYWTTGIIEVLTFSPMMGTGGTYLGFVTGSLSTVKVPCALNAMSAAHVDAGTEEGEVISTIATATSSIVTTLVIALGVLLLGRIRPLLENPALKPAFDNILPALFGAMGVVFISRSPRIAIAPLIVMTALYLLAPGLSGAVGVLVPVSALIAIGVSRLMYKKGML